MATSKLLACNDDVLRLILESACLVRADHRAVCLVHPHLRCLAEPILYSTVRFGIEKIVIGPPSAPRLINLFLRTILSRPDLANCVRSFRCDSQEPYTYIFRDWLSEWYDCELDLGLVATLVRTKWPHVPELDSLINQLANRDMDPHLALLLLFLPNLRSLHLDRIFCSETKWISLVLNEIVFNPSIRGLQHLRSVTFERGVLHFAEPLRNTTDLLPLFYLPSMTRLSLSIGDQKAPAIPWPTAPPPTFPNIAHLKVAEIGESRLGQLLAATPRLQRLDWQWVFQSEGGLSPREETIDLDKLMSALEPLVDTLTELSLAASYGRTCPSPFEIIGHPPVALSEFRQLKKLTIPVVFATGLSGPAANSRDLEKSLPASLEELVITKDMCEYYTQRAYSRPTIGHLRAIKAWLENAKQTLPRLRRLVFFGLFDTECDASCGNDDCVANKENAEVIRRLGVKLGIKLVIDKQKWERHCFCCFHPSNRRYSQTWT